MDSWFPKPAKEHGMTFDELKKMLEDDAVSDDVVLAQVKLFTRDRYDDAGEFIPPTEAQMEEISQMGDLTAQIRPMVIERLQSDFARAFRVGETNCK